MYPAHDFYGHRAVLAAYAGRSPRPIVGYLQHGWQSGWNVVGSTSQRRHLPKLVWSSVNAAALRATGAEHVAAIGAPFVYLDAGRDRPGDAERGLLFYPFHSTAHGAADRNRDDLCAAIAERAGDDDVTVCLYWRDHADPLARRAYEERGWRVVTHGDRFDPGFLGRQWNEIARHRRVATNRVATALWYGAYLDRHVEVFGPVAGSRGPDEQAAFDRVQRSRWPELFEGGLAPGAAHEVAAAELGAEHRLDPDELAAALGWTGWRAVAGPVMATGLRAARAAKRAVGGARPHRSEIRYRDHETTSQEAR